MQQFANGIKMGIVYLFVKKETKYGKIGLFQQKYECEFTTIYLTILFECGKITLQTIS